MAAIKAEAEKRMKAGKVNPTQIIVEGREKISETKKNPTPDKNLSDVHANSTPTKAAELFNTNRTYVNQAAKPSSKGRIGIP